MGLLDTTGLNKFSSGLSKTRAKITNQILNIFSNNNKLADEFFEELEDILISGDIGVETTEKVIREAKKELSSQRDISKESTINAVKSSLLRILQKIVKENPLSASLNNKKGPFVFLIIGVNGVGKTTSIGKLANNFKKEGLKTLIVSADTFRAAANEQLEIWTKRAGVEMFSNPASSDPSAVVFDAMEYSKNHQFDIVLIDTAGRLHTKKNLMDELAKIKRSILKASNREPDEIFLVLDASTGQNAIVQAEKFSEVMSITGIILTKLDGTAKGGVIFQLFDKSGIPVKYVGLGENIDDLEKFDPELFIEAVFSS